ncbi:MAG: cytochrome P450 [Pseudomonadota bacterium]
MAAPPRFEIDMAAFWQDPYPILAQMQQEAPIAYVPQVGAVLFTRRDDIVASEPNIDVFSSHQPDGLMNRLMGQNLMRKDGDAHLAERRVIFPALSPKAVSQHWKAHFQTLADDLLEKLASKGQADLVKDYAHPLSAEALKAMTGLTEIRFQDMDAWSQAMIDGIANYVGDPDVEANCQQATASIDDAIDAMLPTIRRNPDKSLLSVMFHAGMPMEQLRANIKLAISGGQNESRDAIAGAIWALLTHPDQHAKVVSGERDWMHVFDEYTRWISPIGMSPRRVAQHHVIRDVAFAPEDKVFFMFGAANRDETCFPGPDKFDLFRDMSKSIPFGAGPHFCAGAWASKALVAHVALPSLFRRLTGLRLCEDEPVLLGGWAFRGLLNLTVTWDVS